MKCIALVLNMSESARRSYAPTFISSSEKFLTDHESKRPDTRVSCASFESMEHTVKSITSVISVGGILLPTRQSTNQQTGCNLVKIPSTRNNLQSLAIAIGSRKCICLQGPVGCGKTTLVEYLAGVTGHDASDFVKVQLGDQTDSKMLLGMYRCTDVPGEFVWQSGILTQAVVAGKWLLLEDIDSAPLDVASVLNNLIETGTLCVPGYRDTIYADSNFQLFVTQRSTASTKPITGSSSLLQKHWLCLDVEPMSKEELVVVVKTLFPVLSTAATKIISVFLLFSVGNHNNEGNDGILSLKTGRQMSTRDLIKWCSRAIVGYDVSSPDSAWKIFQDAVDVFCCSVTDPGMRLYSLCGHYSCVEIWKFILIIITIFLHRATLELGGRSGAQTRHRQDDGRILLQLIQAQRECTVRRSNNRRDKVTSQKSTLRDAANRQNQFLIHATFLLLAETYSMLRGAKGTGVAGRRNRHRENEHDSVSGEEYPAQVDHHKHESAERKHRFAGRLQAGRPRGFDPAVLA